MADKLYVNGFNIKAIKTQYGNLLKVGIKSASQVPDKPDSMPGEDSENDPLF